MVNDTEKVIKTLRKCHNLETTAVQIYRVQINVFKKSSIADQLARAADNEQSHQDNFYSSLRRLGGAPSPAKPLFWMAGKIIGFVPRLFGKAMIMRANIAFENKAVEDFSKMLKTVPYDAETRSITEKTILDEERHVRDWTTVLASLSAR